MTRVQATARLQAHADTQLRVMSSVCACSRDLSIQQHPFFVDRRTCLRTLLDEADAQKIVCVNIPQALWQRLLPERQLPHPARRLQSQRQTRHLLLPPRLLPRLATRRQLSNPRRTSDHTKNAWQGVQQLSAARVLLAHTRCKMGNVGLRL